MELRLNKDSLHYLIEIMGSWDEILISVHEDPNFESIADDF